MELEILNKDGYFKDNSKMYARINENCSVVE